MQRQEPLLNILIFSLQLSFTCIQSLDQGLAMKHIFRTSKGDLEKSLLNFTFMKTVHSNVTLVSSVHNCNNKV